MSDYLSRRKPLIGITGPNKGSFFSRRASACGVRRAGGEPVQLAPDRPMNPRKLDGIIIGGGSDIDPMLYLEESLIAKQYDSERDLFERRMLDDVYCCDLPVLGICRGAQLMNVVAGGSLHQDVRRWRKKNTIQWTLFPRKPVTVEADSQLAKRFGATNIKVNILHKQAVKALGDGFDLVAQDIDGIAQAIEDTSVAFRVGVQWHPEYLHYQAHQLELFKGLVKAAF